MRGSGRLYEALAARRQHRQPTDLYHSALIVRLDGHDHAIEMAPAWSTGDHDRGVVLEGPVGFSSWGRCPLFRYEVRCWRDGTIPDAATAVDSPCRVGHTRAQALRVLAQVPTFPAATWGRDELHTGEMWNSNSLTSWLLTRSGHDLAAIQAPDGGQAPGWAAGVTVGRSAPTRSHRPD
ncbi:hypothetical protein GCM10027026_03370 [Myroides odoratimimus subsp. xuanwuensis]